MAQGAVRHDSSVFVVATNPDRNAPKGGRVSHDARTESSLGRRLHLEQFDRDWMIDLIDMTKGFIMSSLLLTPQSPKAPEPPNDIAPEPQNPAHDRTVPQPQMEGIIDLCPNPRPSHIIRDLRQATGPRSIKNSHPVPNQRWSWLIHASTPSAVHPRAPKPLSFICKPHESRLIQSGIPTNKQVNVNYIYLGNRYLNRDEGKGIQSFAW